MLKIRQLFFITAILIAMPLTAAAPGVAVFDRPFGDDLLLYAQDASVFSTELDRWLFTKDTYFSKKDVYTKQVVRKEDTALEKDTLLSVVKPGAQEYRLLGSDVRESVAPSLEFQDVMCTRENRRVSFTVENTGEKKWDFTQSTSWDTIATQVNARLYINGFEANKPIGYSNRQGSGELFGPNENFAQNCEGNGILSPGQTMRCILEPVPIESENNMYGNSIWVDVPEAPDPVYFVCA